MAEDYAYNSSDDKIPSWSAKFTSREGDGRGDSEEIYLDALKTAAACKAGGAFLDIGSGLGRIIDLVRPFAGTITGLEPDRERFLSCQDRFRGDANICLLPITCGKYRSSHRRGRFDLITASMVLQHVSTRVCDEILRDVAEMLGRGGVGIVSASHFYEDRYTRERDNSPMEVGAFDRYAEDFGAQRLGIPVRMFSKDSFLRAIERAGLEAVVWRQFGYVRPEHLEGMAGLYRAQPDQLRDHGIAQYALVRCAAPRVTESTPKADLRRRLWGGRGGIARGRG
jgi:cyclopropane fatty-acyl-phospholipid synthase-like methyltransferase